MYKYFVVAVLLVTIVIIFVVKVFLSFQDGLTTIRKYVHFVCNMGVFCQGTHVE